MENNKKLKNLIKSTILGFLNESVNNSFKEGDVLFYKSQYMDEPKTVVVLDIEEYTNNEINSIRIKFKNGNESRLLPYEFKYLSKQKQKKDAYDMVKNIDNQILDIVGYSPNQTSGLLKFIRDDKDIENINISFTEEIKDGRTSKFNINSPLKLKNKILGLDGFKFNIEKIKFDNQQNQESDYSEYINYNYNVIIKKVS